MGGPPEPTGACGAGSRGLISPSARRARPHTSAGNASLDHQSAFFAPLISLRRLQKVLLPQPPTEQISLI